MLLNVFCIHNICFALYLFVHLLTNYVTAFDENKRQKQFALKMIIPNSKYTSTKVAYISIISLVYYSLTYLVSVQSSQLSFLVHCINGRSPSPGLLSGIYGNVTIWLLQLPVDMKSGRNISSCFLSLFAVSTFGFLGFISTGCLVKSWAAILATSKAQPLLFRIIDCLLLPHAVLQQDKELPAVMLAAIRENLPFFLQVRWSLYTMFI